MDGRTIQNRKRSLMAVQRKVSRVMNRALVGREYPILVEGPSRETDLLWEGRIETQAPDIDGVCYINDDGGHPLRPGELRRVRITETHDYDLVGEIIDVPESGYRELAKPAFPILSSHTSLAISRGEV